MESTGNDFKTHVGNRENRIVENEQTMGQMSKQMERQQQSLHEIKSQINREKMKVISKKNDLGLRGISMDHAKVPKVVPDKLL